MTAAQIISTLKLQPLEPEGGYFRQTYKSALAIDGDSKKHSACTAIYYLMTPSSFSRFHRLSGTEIYHFYAGDPVDLALIDPQGRLQKICLGSEIWGEQVPQWTVPSKTWQALRPAGEMIGWSLLGTTMSPGFEWDDFEMGDRATLFRQFPQHKNVIESLTSPIQK